MLLKPVNLGQLSNLVQRLRHGPLTKREPPWDPVTHLYNRSFFTVRLSYSLERAKQIGANRFGVMFIDLQPYAELQERVQPDEVDIFLREVAGHLKTCLRPTDTVSRFDAGVFLVLVEDIPTYSAPSRIAARIELDLGDLIAQKNLMDGLRANVGMILCDAEYADVEEILRDVEVARRLAGSGQARINYDRNMLVNFRGK